MTGRVLIPALLAFATLALPMQTLAQEATPGAPGAQAACTAEPRDIDALLVLWFDANGTPVATPTMSPAVGDVAGFPQGEPVDAETLRAIDQTTRDWFTCFVVTGQYARGFSFMTDELAAMFGPDTASSSEDTPEEVRALLESQLAGTPTAGESGMGSAADLEGPTDARMLPDGRVGALWALQGDQIFIVYEKQGDRWLLDDVIGVLEAGATPTS